MSSNYINRGLVKLRVPCMREGCNNTAYVFIPKGEPLPRGMRKRCPTCASIAAHLTGIEAGNAGARLGNGKARK